MTDWYDMERKTTMDWINDIKSNSAASYGNHIKSSCAFIAFNAHSPGKTKKQTTAISTKRVATGPSCACLFVGYVEQSLFRCYTGAILHLFLRYIDDYWRCLNFTNTFHPNLKFTWIISDTSLPFLDLYISIS
eukprot:g46836.t1